MLDQLIQFLLAVLVTGVMLWAVHWLLSFVEVDQRFKQMILVIVGLILLVIVLRVLGIWVP